MTKSIMRQINTLILIVLLHTSNVYGTDNSLGALLFLAEQEDPLYKEAQSLALAKAEGVPQAKSQIFFPTIKLNARTSRVRDDISTTGFGANGITKYNSRNYSISFTQPIYHHDRFLALAQANKKVQQAQLEVVIAHQELILRLSEAYFEVLASQDNLVFQQAQNKSLLSQLRQAQKKYAVGLIPRTDVEEAKAGYDRSLASLIQAKQLIDNAEEMLREITQNYPTKLASLTNKMPLQLPNPPNIDKWTAAASEKSLVIKSANLDAQIAQKQIHRQSSRSLPTIDLVGGHGYGRQGGRFGASKIHKSDVGLEVNLPLFEGGMTISLTKEARHTHDAKLAKLESAHRAVNRETRQAYLGIVSQIGAVEALKQAVLSSDVALKSTVGGFNVGTRTGVDVVAAERILSESKRDYARSRYDYILETLKLKKAVGTLSPQDLLSIEAWLE
jgi:outer membrane protein